VPAAPMVTSLQCSATRGGTLRYECKQNRDDNEGDHPIGGLNKNLGRRVASRQIQRTESTLPVHVADDFAINVPGAA
jgi:hypothetical protein